MWRKPSLTPSSIRVKQGRAAFLTEPVPRRCCWLLFFRYSSKIQATLLGWLRQRLYQAHAPSGKRPRFSSRMEGALAGLAVNPPGQLDQVAQVLRHRLLGENLHPAGYSLPLLKLT